ncbi:GtrA family protein [Corynebacterium kalidii]|uniref:GtrA family protein n=1 Tax=Corynebacterium kalidii TaxID=2931982 RepID=A0A9X2B2I6_9CORY|nr:GtrA family protein [Corynebacterium kalidii]
MVPDLAAVLSAVAYYLNSVLTFSGERSLPEKSRAAASYVVCFTAAVLVDWAIGHAFPTLPDVTFWSWFVSQGVATTLNFLLQNFWVFRGPRPAPDSHVPVSRPVRHV